MAWLLKYNDICKGYHQESDSGLQQTHHWLTMALQVCVCKRPRRFEQCRKPVVTMQGSQLSTLQARPVNLSRQTRSRSPPSPGPPLLQHILNECLSGFITTPH